jgi:type III pantothenate kinase
MFLAIDIGNTTTSFGVFSDRKYLDGLKISSDNKAEAIESEVIISKSLGHLSARNIVIENVGICSVVPKLTQKYVEISENYFKVTPNILKAEKEYDFRIAYDDRSQLGTDRLANVIAARELYGYPSIVIDMGTATKIEVIASSGDYLGGIIAPGVAISAEALFEKGSQLFPVTFSKPKDLIGTNTADCLQSGIYYGLLGQLKWIINNIKSKYGYDTIKIIGTGGLVNIFEAERALFSDIDSELTLRGLQIALDQ